MNDTAWSVVTGIFLITIVFMLVRPGSAAGSAVKDISNALTNLIKTATTGPADNSSPSSPTGTAV